MLTYLVLVFRFAFASNCCLDFRWVLRHKFADLNWFVYVCIFEWKNETHRIASPFGWVLSVLLLSVRFCFKHFPISLFVVFKLSVLYWFFVWFRLFGFFFISIFICLCIFYTFVCIQSLTDDSDKWCCTRFGSHLSLFSIFQSDRMFNCFNVIEMTSMNICSFQPTLSITTISDCT